MPFFEGRDGGGFGSGAEGLRFLGAASIELEGHSLIEVYVHIGPPPQIENVSERPLHLN